MSIYGDLYTAIVANIRANGVSAITGEVLQNVLLQGLNSLQYIFNPVVLSEGDDIPEDLYDPIMDDFLYQPDEYGVVYPFIKIRKDNKIFDLYYKDGAHARDWVILDGIQELDGIPSPIQYKVFAENGIIKISNALSSTLA